MSIVTPEVANGEVPRRPGATGDGRITPERFQQNPAFVRHLHGLIATGIHQVDGLRRAAQRQTEPTILRTDRNARG